MATSTINVGANVDSAVAEMDRLHAAAKRAADAMARVAVTREPRTYDAVVEHNRRGGIRVVSRHADDRSYFADILRWQLQRDGEAHARLLQHAAEERQEDQSADVLAEEEVRVEMEERAPLASYATPPLWLIDHFATAPRPARVLADLAPSLPLPQGAGYVYLPGMTQGTTVWQQQLGRTVTSTDEAAQQIGSPVTTLAGNFDVPLQLLEQSPLGGAHFDYVAFKQMREDYDFALEYQLINGSGVGNAITGLLKNPLVPSSNVITYTSGSPAATAMFTYLGQLLAAVGNTRNLPATAWLLRTNRFAWLASSEDQQSRPLMIADDTGASGEFDILATRAYQNNAITATSGAGANQDVIIACRPDDWLILESDLKTETMPEVLSGTLEVRLQLRGYAAGLLLQPTSVAYLNGTGMARPTGF